MTEYRTLKGTDLKVSRSCFGTMTFGSQVDEALAASMVNYCLEQGINFFDTANAYQLGVSEQLLGKALRGKRESVVLASKVRGKMGEAPDQNGLSRSAIMRAVEESLQRLQTDYLDIYYLHQPDYDVPIEDSLETMQELVKAGKVRYPASSNYASWQVGQMVSLAQREIYQPASIAQQMYNLVARGLEQEFVPMAKELSVSIIAYNPLAGGLLTGKHHSTSVTPGTRFDQNTMYQDRYWHEQNFRAIETLQSIAQKAGRSLISLSLNWLMHHTVLDCVILGASKLEQLKQNLNLLDEGPLLPEVVELCDEVWKDLRGPTPIYNR
ncbi:MAG: aldo/keto reductase [Acidobacteriota bacterium]|nr:aldo/keto reductase [Acidobacteriota bacterium]